MRMVDLANRIRLGGDGGLELKEVHFRDRKVVGPKRADLADDLTAFANSQGGLLVLGVDNETRRVGGIPLDRLDAVEDLVLEACSDLIHPHWTRKSIDGSYARRQDPGLGSRAFRDRSRWSRFRGASSSTGVPEVISAGSAVPTAGSNPWPCSD